MTRKDYIAIAVAMQRARSRVDAEGETTIDIVIDEVAHVLSMDNQRFDRERFVEACAS